MKTAKERMLCKSCEELQQSLLKSGDGSQVVCDHSLVINEDEGEMETAVVADTVPAGSSRSNNTVNDRK